MRAPRELRAPRLTTSRNEANRSRATLCELRALLRAHRTQRRARVLEGPGRDGLVLDAEALHQAREVEARDDHSDRARHRGRIGAHLVGRHRHVVGARGSGAHQLGDHRAPRLLLEAPHLAVEHLARDHGPARAVDAQQQRRDLVVLERAVDLLAQARGRALAPAEAEAPDSSGFVVSVPARSSIRIFGPASPSTTVSSSGPRPTAPGRLTVMQPASRAAVARTGRARVLLTCSTSRAEARGRTRPTPRSAASLTPQFETPLVALPFPLRSATAARRSAVRALVTDAAAHRDAPALGARRRIRLIHEGAALARGQIGDPPAIATRRNSVRPVTSASVSCSSATGASSWRKRLPR